MNTQIKWVIGLVVIILIIVGFSLFNKSDIPISDELEEDTPTNLTSEVEKQTLPEGWINTSINDLGIKFNLPEDWNVSEVSERTTDNGISVKQVRVYPDEKDSTVVYFFTTQESLSNVKNIELLKSNTNNSIFEDIILNGRDVTQRTDYFTNNDCTKIVSLIDREGTVYGSEIVQCPTHPEGYDKTRIDIANSLELQ